LINTRKGSKTGQVHREMERVTLQIKEWPHKDVYGICVYVALHGKEDFAYNN
jgi:hypothetical protein